VITKLLVGGLYKGYNQIMKDKFDNITERMMRVSHFQGLKLEDMARIIHPLELSGPNNSRHIFQF
jgi:hypothetical protein